MYNSIGYHTRLDSDNTTKVVGGSFGGAIDMETVERLVRAHFRVAAKSSGRLVFVDRSDREVTLYLRVAPEVTAAGQCLLAELREARAAKQREEDEARATLMERIEEMDSDELRRLLGE